MSEPTSVGSPTALLRAAGVVCQFGGVRAVDGVELSLDGGCCLGITGPNGSGKSTLLDVLSGLRAPTAGRVEVDGAPIAPRPEAFAAAGVRRTFQNVRLFDGLGIDDNIALGLNPRLRHLLGLPMSDRRLTAGAVSAARTAVGLDLPGRTLVARLSYGQRKRVELARVLVSEPRIVLLDEPMAGVSQDDRSALAGAVRRLSLAGAAVAIVEHDLEVLAALAQRVVVMEAGRIVADGDHDGAAPSSGPAAAADTSGSRP
jgi:ABC-type branched-subunit amino acid transport system ATPase component